MSNYIGWNELRVTILICLILEVRHTTPITPILNEACDEKRPLDYVKILNYGGGY